MLRDRGQNVHGARVLPQGSRTDQTLGDLVETQGPLDESRARFYLRQIAEAVRHCHKFGVVHRDLKPDNIIFSEDMSIKLIDFGLSNMIGKSKKVT